MAQLSLSPIKPTVEYFERLIAKAIMWKRTERLVTEQQFGGYRANIVAYAIAKISHSTAQRIDLGRVWSEQALDPTLEDCLVQCSHLAWKVLVELAPAGANITEWAKQERCWRTMRDEEWPVPEELSASLVVLAQGGQTPAAPSTPIDDPAVAACAAVAPDQWLALSNWAKETGNLQPWQRKLSYDIGVRMKRGRPPSVKQSRIGVRILEEARRLGFAVSRLRLCSGLFTAR